ncbi:hypothetical protein JX266_006361 [Neoarthrinium moseri]|nr:hypothetical protein JX266_006361 [Neoarthrinium moseri]
MAGPLNTQVASSPVSELRDASGDSNPPDSNRKITACVACRKQKIKCHMPGSRPPCSRCNKRGLSCTVNRSLQMLLESDTVWKDSVEKKIQGLQDAIDKLTSQAFPQEKEQHPDCQGSPELQMNRDCRTRPAQLSSDILAQNPTHWNVVLDPQADPGTVPGSYIAQINITDEEPRAHHRGDLVSKGIIALDRAKLYFENYQQRLDHFVYRVLGDHCLVTFEGTRGASPMLLAATCTVGALHSSSRIQDFNACRAEFVSLCERQSMVSTSNIEDVQALCIGAFWLTDVSWSLVAAAVRAATDLQLHKSFFKAIRGDQQHYLRARLYYHVYACDHHASIAFGKPPLTRDCEAVRRARDFLGCKQATEDDARLVSQVCRWSLLSSVFNTFGVDVDRPLINTEIAELRKFGIALDSLRAEWVDRFAHNAHVGNYPSKGVSLQYYFARLYLCSHAFRGAGSGSARSNPDHLDIERDEIANMAVLSAISILRCVVSDSEIASFLNGLPTYFDVMITFAVVFLLKVSAKPSSHIPLDSHGLRDLIHKTVTTLIRVTSTMNPRHVLVSISKGLSNLWQQSYAGGEDASTNITSSAEREHPTEPWNGDVAFDPYFLSAFDFQAIYTMDAGLDLSMDNIEGL